MPSRMACLRISPGMDTFFKTVVLAQKRLGQLSGVEHIVAAAYDVLAFQKARLATQESDSDELLLVAVRLRC